MSSKTSTINYNMFAYEYFLQENVCRFCWGQKAEKEILCENFDKISLRIKILDCLGIDVTQYPYPKRICNHCVEEIEKLYRYKKFAQEIDRKLHEVNKRICVLPGNLLVVKQDSNILCQELQGLPQSLVKSDFDLTNSSSLSDVNVTYSNKCLDAPEKDLPIIDGDLKLPFAEKSVVIGLSNLDKNVPSPDIPQDNLNKDEMQTLVSVGKNVNYFILPKTCTQLEQDTAILTEIPLNLEAPASLTFITDISNDPLNLTYLSDQGSDMPDEPMELCMTIGESTAIAENILSAQNDPLNMSYSESPENAIIMSCVDQSSITVKTMDPPIHISDSYTNMYSNISESNNTVLTETDTLANSNVHVIPEELSTLNNSENILEGSNEIASSNLPVISKEPATLNNGKIILEVLNNDNNLQSSKELPEAVKKTKAPTITITKNQCQDCRTDFATEEDFLLHNSVYHGIEENGKYRCFGCNRKFKSRKTRLVHEKKLCKELRNGYVCNICSVVQANRKQYDIHVKSHLYQIPLENIDEYKCDKCSKTFKGKMNLRVHEMVDHEEKKVFICDTCGRSFTRRDYLYKHQLTHEGIRQHKCPHCDFSSTQRSSLTVHIRKHTGERPYFCDICPQTCVSSSNLRAHIRRHLGDKKYQCKICKRKFGYKNSLEEHVASKHEQPIFYHCQHCSATYSRLRGLRRHLAAKHAKLSKSQDTPLDGVEQTTPVSMSN